MFLRILGTGLHINMAEAVSQQEAQETKETATEKAAEKAPSQNYKHIVRVANVDLPGDRQIRWALTNIKGIGIDFADALCIAAGIQKTAKTGYLTDQQTEKLNASAANPAAAGIPGWLFNRRKDPETGIDAHIVGGMLSFIRDNDIKRMKRIRSYKGMRHGKGLPVRGQRTRSNFRRHKGKVVGVAKKKAAAAAAEAGKKKEKK